MPEAEASENAASAEFEDIYAKMAHPRILIHDSISVSNGFCQRSRAEMTSMIFTPSAQ
jgi:hypothetical protein